MQGNRSFHEESFGKCQKGFHRRMEDSLRHNEERERERGGGNIGFKHKEGWRAGRDERVYPANISYISTPRAHQSTLLLCPVKNARGWLL